MFGPFTAGRKHVYVAVALDCYSQFPEAMVIENISAATLTTFVVNLICRYILDCFEPTFSHVLKKQKQHSPLLWSISYAGIYS